MTAVKSSDFQKNVGFWLDRLNDGPVRITKYDRAAAVLISASQYEELITNYRKVITVDQLSDAEVAMIRNAKVQTKKPFTLSDLPEVELREPVEA
ncbi:MAG: type II toxin-antitoxin system Phd/YefM family antitoxin [Devosia sp.]|nr:type II toxin-antitoxin system Phd/YefM family antitoxin [Devosia sp.]